MRRIETASRPSPSAIAIAAAVIAPDVSEPRRLPMRPAGESASTRPNPTRLVSGDTVYRELIQRIGRGMNRPTGRPRPIAAMPGVEDERQVVEQRARLAELARSWRGRPVGDADLEEALDAAEFVLRLHFLGGLGTQLEQLLP